MTTCEEKHSSSIATDENITLSSSSTACPTQDDREDSEAENTDSFQSAPKTISFWDDSALEKLINIEPAYVQVGSMPKAAFVNPCPEEDAMKLPAYGGYYPEEDAIMRLAAYGGCYPEENAMILQQKAEALKLQALQLEQEAQRIKKKQLTSQPSTNTTVMLRNIPNNIKRDELVALLDKNGFFASFDFLYLPMDFKRDASLGYAFVNLINPEKANEFMAKFTGFKEWDLASTKEAEVCWGHPLQGLEAHIDRYRNSPVMHASVPVYHKPLYLKDGKPEEFPAPTKRIRAPRQSDRN